MSNHPIDMPRAVVAARQTAVTRNDQPASRPQAGVLLIAFTVLVTLLHAFLVWALAAHRHDPSYALGQVFGGALLGPLIVVALFKLHPRFRNPKSTLSIFLWTLVCSIVGMISRVAPAVAV